MSAPVVVPAPAEKVLAAEALRAAYALLDRARAEHRFAGAIAAGRVLIDASQAFGEGEFAYAAFRALDSVAQSTGRDSEAYREMDRKLSPIARRTP